MPDAHLYTSMQLCLTDHDAPAARFDEDHLYVTFTSHDERVRMVISGSPEEVYGLASDLMNHALDCGARPGGVDDAFERQGRHTARAVAAARALAELAHDA